MTADLRQIVDVAPLVRSGSLSPITLVESCLAQIDARPEVNAFITRLDAQALNDARVAAEDIREGRYHGPLHGIPISLKDLVHVAGVKTTSGSAVPAVVPAADAPAVTRLRAAGAIIVGKTNLHEFAFGTTSEETAFGPVRNPLDSSRSAGGSSGGAAAALAAGMCFGALGTDTGGSIRTPSSYCSVVGLKPTYGLVPIRGIIPLVVSLDHCGPITRSVADAALMLQVLAGYDRLDIASVEHPAENYVQAMAGPVKALRVGIARVPFFDLVDADVAKAVDAAIGVISKLTASTADVVLPTTREVNLGGEMYAWHEALFAQMSGRYQIPTRRNLQNGGNAKASEYIRGRWALELVRRTIDDSFTDVDVVVLPTRRHTPRTVDAALEREETDKPRNPELENTGQFNIYGIPAVSVPCGFTDAGLPVGLMIAGPRFSEGRVLALARAFEQATDWHSRRPPLTPDTPVPPLKRVEP